MMKKKHIILVGLFGVWLASSIYAFWWFEYKDLRLYSRLQDGSIVALDAEHLENEIRRLIIPQDIGTSNTLIHFWNPECGCNRANLRHLQEILRQYADKDIQLILAVSETLGYDKIELQGMMSQYFEDAQVVIVSNRESRLALPSSPAAALFIGKEMRYFGPYSSGAVCSADKKGFIEQNLTTNLSDSNSKQFNTLVYGCFCDWQRTNS